MKLTRHPGFLKSLWITLFLHGTLLALPPHGEKWRDLLSVADSLHERGMSDSAAVLGLRALTLTQGLFGESDTAVGLAFHKLGEYYSHGSTYDKAEDCFRRALAIREQLLLPDHVDIGRTLSRLGRLLLSKDRDKAEAMLKRSLDILESSVSASPSDVALAYLNLGTAVMSKGRSAEARSHFEKALELYKRGRADHPDIAHCLVNLGIVNYGIGSVDESIRYFNQAISFYEIHPQPSYLPLGNILSNYGALLSNEGKMDQAVPVMKRAISIFETARDTSYLLFNLANLGTVYEQKKDYDAAEQTLLRASDIYSMKPPRDQQGPIEVFNRLGSLYRVQGKYDMAISYIAKSRDIKAQLYGPNALETVEVESSLIPIFRRTNNNLDAFRIGWRLLRGRREHLLANIALLPEGDALTMAAGTNDALGELLSIYADIDHREDSLSSMAARAVLLAKGEVSEKAILIRQLEIEKADTLFRQLLARSKEVNERMARSVLETDAVPAQRRMEFDSLSELSRHLESELALLSPAFHLNNLGDAVLDQVLSVLPQRSSLVEFIRYNYTPRKAEGPRFSRYSAVVIANSSPIRIVELGRADTIDAVVEDYRRHLLSIVKLRDPVSIQTARDYSTISARLYSLVWKPLNNYIKPGHTLFIAPDGGLNLISFAGLLCPDSSYLIEKHPVHYLTAGRDLIRLKAVAEHGSGILVLGDPDYNAPVEARTSLISSVIGSNPSEATRDHQPGTTNLRSSCGSLSEIVLQPLAGTRSEVRSAERLYRGRHKDEGSKIFLGSTASEEQFKRMAPGRRALHLATHGFYLGGDCKDTISRPLEENPLLQSGLFLAGANLHGRGADKAGAEDGILTALEVAGMNLHKTDLVVLSACETGLGKVMQGEGVFGLRRAFQLAGARTVVSALWQIPDDEGMKFMNELYSQNGSTYPELMQKVALSRIRELRARGRPIHPFAWAGFIAVGDWRIN